MFSFSCSSFYAAIDSAVISYLDLSCLTSFFGAKLSDETKSLSLIAFFKKLKNSGLALLDTDFDSIPGN